MTGPDSWSDWFALSTFALVLTMMGTPVLVLLGFYLRDRGQRQHSVLRNFPLLGRLRYLLEHIGPEMRQYLFESDRSGKPFSRDDYEGMVFAGKYMKTLVSFGSKRDYEEPGWYLRNGFLPTPADQMQIDTRPAIETKRYVIDRDGLMARREHHESVTVAP